MKKYLLSIVIVVITTIPFSNLSAQCAIPSSDVELVGSDISFSEEHHSGLMIAEERKLKVRTSSKTESTDAWIIIGIGKKDSGVSLGPFIVDEGTVFEFGIDEDEWEVRVIDYSSEALASVWIEDLQ
jgi:hypothetical protein